MKKRIITFFLLIPYALIANFNVGVIGDSVSRPYPILEKDCYHAILARKYNWNILNYSVDCSKTDTLLCRAKHMVENGKPDLIIIELGINDAGTVMPLIDFFRNFRSSLDFLSSQNIPIIVGIVDVRFFTFSGQNYCETFLFSFSILKELFPQIHLFDFMSYDFLSHFYLYNYFHPMEDGHKKISENLENFMMESNDLRVFLSNPR